jgi:hypothetical protein
MSTTKRRSTGKLSQLGRANRNSRVSLTQKVGMHLISSSSRGRMSPSIFMNQRSSEPNTVPKSSSDQPPSIPRRRSSLMHARRLNDCNEGSDGQGQHNFVFGQVGASVDHGKQKTVVSQNATPPQRWMQKETNKDLPPSFNKSTSVSALNSFGSITIKSKNSTMDLSSGSQKRDLPPKMPSSQKLDPSPPDPMYEVSPGVQERLRGAQETWSYLQRDFYLPTSCKGCSVELTCIKNLDYVLCPTCQVITSIDAPPEARGGGGGGGLGLGFTLEDLRKWEMDRMHQTRVAYSA